MTGYRRFASAHGLWKIGVLSCVGLLIFGSVPTPSLGQVISTVVGPSTADNVPAVSTGLYQPVMTFVDGAGNVYFSDHQNHRVRKIDTSGTITTLAGNGTRGFSGDGGSAANALVDHPYGIYVDVPGDVYFCDLFNHRVRKIDTNGVITTVAGNGIQTFAGDGGPAALASLNNPIDVAMDATGNLYISDSTNRRIRKVDSGGTITTFAGNGISGFSGDGGPAVSASVASPYGMDFDVAGNLYFGDIGNHRVRKIDTGGTITTVAGNGTFGFSGDGGPAPNAWFRHPWDVAVGPSGDLFIADLANHRIRKVNASGTISTFAGSGSAGFSGDGGPAVSAQLGRPFGIHVDGFGNLFIADTGNNRIRMVDPSGNITTVAGTGVLGYNGDGIPAISANIYNPTEIVTDPSGSLYIADLIHNRIRKVVNVTPPTNQPPVADAGGPYSVAEGDTVTVTALGSDPDGDPLTYAWDLENNGSYETAGQSAIFSAAALDGPSAATIGVQVTDSNGALAEDQATVNVVNVDPTVDVITAPVDPVQVGTEINAAVSFTDLGVPDTHTASWDWGDNSTSAGTVDQVNDTVGGTHTYTEAGVYTLTLTVTDDDGGVGSSIYTYVVVVDPNGGFVTGGGWIDSPEGSYTEDPTLTGKANFGFVSKYQNGQSTPTGQTQFKFKAGDLKFHSTEYDWLVVAGPQAKFKGSGTINGQSGFDFMLAGRDGQANGGGAVDRFRIKIWGASTESVVYDNQLGDADDGEATDAIEGGSVTIHNGGAAKPALGSKELTFGAENYPNPFNPSSTIRYSLPEASEVRLTVYSALGQEIRTLVSQHQEAGVYTIQWDGLDAAGREVATGLYLYQLQAGGNLAVQKMLVVR